MYVVGSEQPVSRPAVATLALIAVNVLVFVLEVLLGDAFVLRWSFTPAAFTAFLRGTGSVEALVTVCTSMFLHGSLGHLLGNLLFLWVFGQATEDALGSRPYGRFSLACGVVATCTQYAVAPNSPVPNLGASGAIAGVMGGYLAMYPGSRIRRLRLAAFAAHPARPPRPGVAPARRVVRGAAAVGRRHACVCRRWEWWGGGLHGARGGLPARVPARAGRAAREAPGGRRRLRAYRRDAQDPDTPPGDYRGGLPLTTVLDGLRWASALRGLVALAIGLLALVWPATALAGLVVLVGVSVLVDGIVLVTRRRARRRRPALAVRPPGPRGHIAAGVAVVSPQGTVVAAVFLFGAWAISTGLVEAAVALRLTPVVPGAGLLGVGGVLSIVLGVLLVRAPDAGALIFARLFGAYQLAVGVVLMTLAARQRQARHRAPAGPIGSAAAP